MNKIKQELLTVIDGLDVDNAYSVVKEKAILFSLFCAENYFHQFQNQWRNYAGSWFTTDELFKIFEETL